MVQAPVARRTWTYQDYLELDDDQRYEILEGELIMVPAPDTDHQGRSRDLGFTLWGYVKARRLGTVYFAPCDVILDDDNVLQPDILFVALENQGIIKKRGVFGAPDMVVEIISPSSDRTDRTRKKTLYERFGVREDWIVDHAREAVEVWVLTDAGYRLFCSAQGTGQVRSQVILGFVANLDEFLSDKVDLVL